MIMIEKVYRLYKKFTGGVHKHHWTCLLKRAVSFFQKALLNTGMIPAVFGNGFRKFRRSPRIMRLLAISAFALTLAVGIFYWQLIRLRITEPPPADPPFDWSAYLPIDTLDPAFESPTERNRNDPRPEDVAGSEKANPITPVNPTSAEPVITKGLWPVRGELFYGFHETVIQQSQDYPIYYTSTGIAIIAERGSEAVSPWDGTIIKISPLDKPHGQSVTIEHDNGLISYHGALEKVMVTVGNRISQGQPFALVGSGIESEPDYLYLEITKDGKAVNPLEYLAP